MKKYITGLDGSAMLNVMHHEHKYRISIRNLYNWWKGNKKMNNWDRKLPVYILGAEDKYSEIVMVLGKYGRYNLITNGSNGFLADGRLVEEQ